LSMYFDQSARVHHGDLLWGFKPSLRYDHPLNHTASRPIRDAINDGQSILSNQGVDSSQDSFCSVSKARPTVGRRTGVLCSKPVSFVENTQAVSVKVRSVKVGRRWHRYQTNPSNLGLSCAKPSLRVSEVSWYHSTRLDERYSIPLRNRLCSGRLSRPLCIHIHLSKLKLV